MERSKSEQIKFVLVKYPGKNIMLEVLGRYTTEEERKIISSAGWGADDIKMPKISEDLLKQHPQLRTETFYPPAGSGIFGGHTRTEAKKHRQAIEGAFQNAGIPIYYRRGNLQELL